MLRAAGAQFGRTCCRPGIPSTTRPFMPSTSASFTQVSRYKRTQSQHKRAEPVTFPTAEEIDQVLSEDKSLLKIIPPTIRTYRPPALPSAPCAKSAIPESFAVVLVGGKQFKVTKGDVIVSERLEADVGSSILLRKVLLVGTKEMTAIGQPLLQRAAVEAVVEEQTRAAKVIIFKKKRRKGYRRTKGHRQYITTLRIGDVRLDPNEDDADS